MNTLETQHVVRELLVEADSLSRRLYEADDVVIAWRLAALRTTLQRIDRRLGSGYPGPGLTGELDVAYQRIVDIAATAGSDRLAHLMTNATRLRDQTHPSVPPTARPPTPPPEAPKDVAREAGAELAATVTGVSALAAAVSIPRLRRSPLAWGLAAGVLLVSVLWVAQRSRA
jgi:hypothetical protein